MKNNDILNSLKMQSESIQSGEDLSPMEIEGRLKGVRRSRRKIYTAAASVLLCVCLIASGGYFLPGMFDSGSDYVYIKPRPVAQQSIDPNQYTDVYSVVRKIKDANEIEYNNQNESSFLDYVGRNFFGGAKSSTNNYLPESDNSSYGYYRESNDVESQVGGVADYYNSAYPQESESDEVSPTNTEYKYSDTNTQVKGVSEADIIKTDGSYIYSLSVEMIYGETGEYEENLFLNIAKIDNGNMTKMSRTELDFVPNDMYVYGDLLIITEQSYSGVIMPYGVAESSFTTSCYDYDSYYLSQKSKLHFFDISDRSRPKEANVLTLDGSTVSTRMIGSTLYLVTDYTINDLTGIDEDDPRTFVPNYSEIMPKEIATDDEIATGDEVPIDPKDIYICGEPKDAQYISIASVNLKDPAKFAEVKTILAGGNNVYCNFENLFVTVDAYTFSGDYWESKNMTNIVRCKIDGTKLEITGEGEIPGSVLNQFSMDENDGYFRIVTENWEESATRLYVLDGNLKVVGKTESVGKNENLKSVRFDGDVCYFVTFRTTDPLFTVDLSNPANPTILHELKIPGFSEYMHPFGEGLLLGVGFDADEETGWTKGIKLSMFDVSNKNDVSVINDLILDEKYYPMGGGFSEHKSLFVDSGMSMFGFCYQESGWTDWTWEYDVEKEEVYGEDYYGETVEPSGSYEKYYYGVFKYEDGKIKQVAKIALGSSENGASNSGFDPNIFSYGTRGFYIDNSFYIVNSNYMFSYNLSDFSKIAEIKF